MTNMNDLVRILLALHVQTMLRIQSYSSLVRHRCLSWTDETPEEDETGEAGKAHS